MDNLQNDKNNKRDQKEKRQVEEFYFKNILMKKEIEKNSDFEKKFSISVNMNIYDIHIKYDLGRGNWQAWIIIEGKKRSLSFFPKYEDAYANIITYIAAICGDNVAASVDTSQKVGD